MAEAGWDGEGWGGVVGVSVIKQEPRMHCYAIRPGTPPGRQAGRQAGEVFCFLPRSSLPESLAGWRARWRTVVVVYLGLGMRFVSSCCTVIYSFPLFFFSLFLPLFFFSLQLGWLPAFGMETVAGGLHGWARFKDVGLHLILPTLSLGCFFMSVDARLARASMLEVLGQDFIKTARAKGVPVGEIIRNHALRNALLPVVTFAGIQLGQMAGGAVLTETVFGWPGIGRLMFDSLIQRDYQLLLGVFLMTSIMVVVFNFITDLIYRFIDPRIE